MQNHRRSGHFAASDLEMKVNSFKWVVLPIGMLVLGCGAADVSVEFHIIRPEDGQASFVTESGFPLESPTYEVLEGETLIEQRVFAPGESNVYKVNSTGPLVCGFKAPFGDDDVDRLAFEIDPEDPMQLKRAGRLDEVNRARQEPGYAAGIQGATITVKPLAGLIRFRFTSQMAEPMEFMIYTRAADETAAERL